MQDIFSSDERFLCENKSPLAAGDRKRDVGVTGAGSQIKQSLALFRMLFYKLAETELDIVPRTQTELYYIKKKSYLFSKQMNTLILIAG